MPPVIEKVPLTPETATVPWTNTGSPALFPTTMTGFVKFTIFAVTPADKITGSGAVEVTKLALEVFPNASLKI
jgi:hypothetical protein